jgi:hypothetical protein
LAVKSNEIATGPRKNVENNQVNQQNGQLCLTPGCIHTGEQ